ncbi:putative efflux protein, MATE family [Granulicatella balaenopterae]|uniref:Probable multidrug resistance protein NorM n=1 Tax=Granulicatella balaenopterae TaxID=137733 RepID=A0A1H9GYR8_9LACT|nr:MATE family efflux transporter [Granulicatella balaenopterae]SEQ55194.1 putative efflux protein, MATE family [Granulicatella balaenopterae]
MKKVDLVNDSIVSAMIRFSLPIILALFLQALYGACDLWAVGQFATPVDMSAVSTSSQVLLMLNGLMTGIFSGTTILLGLSSGERRFDKSRQVFAGTFWIILIMSAVVTVVLGVFAEKIAVMANAPEAALLQTTNYLRICGMGTFFIISYNGISALFRGVGNSTLPLMFVAIAGATNMILDIVLIKYFEMGATGAAYATVFAQGLSVVLSLIFMKRYDFDFSLDKRIFTWDYVTIKEIMQIGLPIGLLQLCNEFYYFILIGFVNRLGVTESAGVGVAEKLILFLILIPLSFMTALSSFVSFNIGAGQKERAKKGLFTTMKLSVSLGFVMASILFFLGSHLAGIFSENEAVKDCAGLFLKATSLECFILSIVYCLTGYFNGLKRSSFVMLQGVAVIFLVKIPYAFIAQKYLPYKLFNLGLSTVLGAASSLVLCVGYYLYLERRIKKVSH